eukprot:50296-Rhodomonas_salina.4
MVEKAMRELSAVETIAHTAAVSSIADANCPPPPVDRTCARPAFALSRRFSRGWEEAKTGEGLFVVRKLCGVGRGSGCCGREEWDGCAGRLSIERRAASHTPPSHAIGHHHHHHHGQGIGHHNASQRPTSLATAPNVPKVALSSALSTATATHL